jgi:acyl-CoA thioester hydrolase
MSVHEAPFDRYRDRVRSEWIDENGHMNMGFYVVVFDKATDAFLDEIGLDAEHKSRADVTTFTLEAHVNYLQEVRESAPLRFTTQLFAYDEKRMHYMHAMYHADEGFLAATNELMSLHVSQKTRRAAPMAPEVRARLARLLEAHAGLPRPPQAGRSISLSAGRAS